MLNEQLIRKELNTKIALFFYDEITSTNDVIDAKKEKYALVVTKHQTSGRGRQSRKWESCSQSSLTFSFYHHQPLNKNLALWQIVVANTIVECLPDVNLKWPNDLFFHEGKCGGILVETDVRGKLAVVVSGIGINIGKIHATPKEYSISNVDLIACPNFFIANLANRLLHKVSNFDVLQLCVAFNENHIFHGKEVDVIERDTNHVFKANVMGLNYDGRLIVQRDNEDFVLGENFKIRVK